MRIDPAISVCLFLLVFGTIFWYSTMPMLQYDVQRIGCEEFSCWFIMNSDWIYPVWAIFAVVIAVTITRIFRTKKQETIHET